MLALPVQIPIVADLPVGENLRDHVVIAAIAATLDKPATFVPERLGLLDKLQYDFLGTGLLLSDNRSYAICAFHEILILQVNLLRVNVDYTLHPSQDGCRLFTTP